MNLKIIKAGLIGLGAYLVTRDDDRAKIAGCAIGASSALIDRLPEVHNHYAMVAQRVDTPVLTEIRDTVRVLNEKDCCGAGKTADASTSADSIERVGLIDGSEIFFDSADAVEDGDAYVIHVLFDGLVNASSEISGTVPSDLRLGFYNGNLPKAKKPVVVYYHLVTNIGGSAQRVVLRSNGSIPVSEYDVTRAFYVTSGDHLRVLRDDGPAIENLAIGQVR